MKSTSTGPALAYRGAWGVLTLLFVINLLNFVDRMLPAVVLEDIRRAYGLSDLWLGILVSSFTVAFALCGLPLGRVADKWIRRNVLAGGVLAWSAFTALSGIAPNFLTFYLARLGVGIGEASYGPAAVSMIGDMFPQARRGRAMGLFMLGLPIGISLSFIIISKIKALTGSWQIPFVLAGVVGLLAGGLVLLVREPVRGAQDDPAPAGQAKLDKPFRKVFAVRTLWWICLSGVTVNMASYGTNTFFNSLLQRYYGVASMDAGWMAASVLGLTGLLAMTVGAYLADLAHKRNINGRLKLGAYCLLAAAPLVALALCETRGSDMRVFMLLYSSGWMLFFMYYVSVYTAVQDVVEPRLRATAMSVYFAAQYLVGSTLGTTLVGGLSDFFARQEMAASGATVVTDAVKGLGLHLAMFVVPVMLLVTGLVLLIASRSFTADVRRLSQFPAESNPLGSRFGGVKQSSQPVTTA
jgi:predicted MFS family arabinose efflux permease